jgi:hypothetical protein
MVQLTEAGYFSPELNAPLRITSARLLWSGNTLQVQPLELQVGENRLSGTLQRSGPTLPWEVSLTGTRLRLADVNALVNPAQRGLFERLVRSETHANWKRIAAVAKLRLQELEAGPFRLNTLEVDGDWRAGVLSLQRLRFRAYAGRFDGRFQADFRNSPPRYRLAGNVRQMSVAGLASATRLSGLYTGLASAEMALDTAGTRPRDLVRNLQGRLVGGVNHGALTHINLLAAMAEAAGETAESVAPGGATPMQSLTGEFRIADERVELEGVQLILDGAALRLSGAVTFDGGMNLEVRGEPLQVAGREATAAGSRLLTGVYRFRGTLAEPRVEVVEPPRPSNTR